MDITTLVAWAPTFAACIPVLVGAWVGHRLKSQLESELAEHRVRLATTQRLHEIRCLAIAELHKALMEASNALGAVSEPFEFAHEPEEWDRERVG